MNPLVRLLPSLRTPEASPATRLLVAGVCGLVAASAAQIAGPMLVAHAIDVDLAAGDRRGLAIRCALYAGTLVATLGATLGSRVALEVAAQRAMLALKRRLFDHLLGQDMAFHDRMPSGALIGRVQGDVEALRVLLVEVLLAAPADALLMVGMLCVLFAQVPVLAPPIAAVLPVWFALFLVFRRVAPQRFVLERAAAASTTGLLTEVVRALPALRVLGRHPWAVGLAEERIDAQARAEIASHLQSIWYFNGVQAIRAAATVATLTWGAALVARGHATVGGLVLALGYLRQLFQPLMRLSNHLATLERARASAGRIAQLLETEPAITSRPGARPWPGLSERLVLDGVSFRYREDAPILCDVSIEVPAGKRVGLVGATGSGKSTVVDLALRLRDPDLGRVTVDGVDLRDVRLADLRARTALVLQDVRLLPGTVLDNIGCDAQTAQRALDALGLALPLDRQADDGTLSRGERQLVTFARALVRDPDLLVLDEATSAVDPATEAVVQRALRELMEGRTVIMVAHRLDTVRDCDRIYVLREGRVVEAGSHAELVARDGEYAAMVRLQAAA